MNMRSDASAAHRWKFFRTGGFDQVCIETADDLRHLDQLDQKLWAVLTVPTSGLEFDEHTLQLIDRRSEGCVRVPDLLAAVKWTCDVLRDPQILFEPGDSLPLQALDEGHADGAAVACAARALLAALGRPDDRTVSLADLSDTSALFAANQFNGDGVVVPGLSADPDVAAAIATIVGAHAGELIAPWAVAVSQRLKVSTMAGVTMPYPTLSEAGKRAAGSWFAPRLFAPRTKKIVRFLFDLPC